STTLGGISWMPRALRIRNMTIASLANDVTITAMKGASERPTSARMRRNGSVPSPRLSMVPREDLDHAHAETPLDVDQLAATDQPAVHAKRHRAVEGTLQIDHVALAHPPQLADREVELTEVEGDRHAHLLEVGQGALGRLCFVFFVRGHGLLRDDREGAVGDARSIAQVRRDDDRDQVLVPLMPPDQDDVVGLEPAEFGGAEPRAAELDTPRERQLVDREAAVGRRPVLRELDQAVGEVRRQAQAAAQPGLAVLAYDPPADLGHVPLGEQR